MRLEDLPLRHRIAVCRGAATSGVAWLRTLSRRVDPGDEPLLRLFQNLTRVGEAHLAAMGGFGAQVDSLAPTAVEQKDLDGIVARSIPSLSRAPTGRFIDREAGTYLVECLQEESAGLYRSLAEQAPDEESRAFFLHSKKEAESNLQFVRQVLL